MTVSKLFVLPKLLVQLQQFQIGIVIDWLYGTAALRQGCAGRWFQHHGRFVSEHLLIFRETNCMYLADIFCRWRARVLRFKPSARTVVYSGAFQSGTNWFGLLKPFFHCGMLTSIQKIVNQTIS